jgi:hypothetical protein
MTAPTWQEMSPFEFDRELTPDRKARKFIASAPETLFPRLMPRPPSTPALVPQSDPLGTPDMFATLEDA